jgi:hypothetical protein
MQMRAAAAGLSIVAVPVGQRRQVGGVSHVSGSWRRAMRAAAVIGLTLCRLAVALRRKG